MINKGYSGKDAEFPFHLPSSSNPLTPVTGHSFSTGEVQIRVAGGSLVNADVTLVVEIGNGDYALQLTGAQTAATGKAFLYVNVSGAQVYSGFEDVLDIGAIMLAASHDTGRTVKGAFRRMDAMDSGKATGLDGTAPTFYMADGVTVALTAVQDPVLGNRAAATVTGSES